MVKGLLHCALCTKDMQASLHFYCDVLGGNHIMGVDEPAGVPLMEMVQFKDGTCVELFHPRPEAPFGSDVGRNHPCFVVEDINALVQKLDEGGCRVDVRPRVARDGNLQMWCEDPNGYRLEFMQMHSDSPLVKKGAFVRLS